MLSYTLEVKGLLPEETMPSEYNYSASEQTQRQNITVNSNISENTLYTFRVLASNSVGVVSTKEMSFCESQQ